MPKGPYRQNSRLNKFIELCVAGREAIDAFYQAGYKSADRATAKKRCQAMLKRKDVMEALAAGKEKALAAAVISRARILSEESCIAFADVNDIYAADGKTVLPPSQLPPKIRKAIKSIHEHTTKTGTKYSYTFYSKGKALERLSKVAGLYEKDNDQKTPKGSNGVQISVKLISESEAETDER